MTDRDEQGSLIIALAVILVLSGLTLAVLARTVSALGSARLAQDSAGAVAAADAGVADALYVLDHTSETGPTVIPPATTASYHWTATVTDAYTASVTSTGTVNGHSHTVTVTATRAPWVVATAGSLVLDGTNQITAAVPAPQPRLAAGGALVLRDGASGGAGQDLLGPGASCAGCASPTVVAGMQLPDPTPVSPPPSPPPCGTMTSLTPGTLVCSAPLTFSGVVPALPLGQSTEIFVMGGGAPATVVFGGASVNDGGDPTALVLHIVGAGIVDPGTGPPGGPGSGSFTGVLDAPRSSLRSSDCEFSLTGGAALGSLDCVTPAPAMGPFLTLDSRVVLPGDMWQPGVYQDVAGP